jgi:hypothetical protein
VWLFSGVSKTTTIPEGSSHPRSSYFFVLNDMQRRYQPPIFVVVVHAKMLLLLLYVDFSAVLFLGSD